MLTLADLIDALIGRRPEIALYSISEAVIDSRKATDGSLFVAMPGEHKDGHDYIGNAFEHGAIAALIQRDVMEGYPILDIRKQSEVTADDVKELPICIRVEDSLASLQEVARFWRRKQNPRIIGITGSVGKSTTKEVLAEVLSQRFKTLKNPGNLNNEIGLPLTLLSLSEQHEHAVLEMGFYVPGEIAFLCDIAMPQVGVITNIGTVHAERAGSQEAIARGKSELVQALPPAPEGVAVLNYDDILVREMASKTNARVFNYGLNSHAHLWADNVEGLGLEGIRLRLHYKGETQSIRVPMIGRHSVHTVLRAAAVGLIEGLSWQEIVDGLRSGKAQLRLVAVPTESGAIILDDTYNASPASTLAALNLLDELEGHKIAVLGDMLELGPYEKRGHEMVGVRAAEVVDQLITVGQLGCLIALAARKARFPSQNINELADSSEAIDFLKTRLGSKDVVLIKGSRGMRMDRIVSALEKHQ